MDNLELEMQDILSRAREARQPTDADMRRVEGRIMAQVGAGVFAGATIATGASGAATVTGAVGGAKALKLVIIAVAMGTAAVGVHRRLGTSATPATLRAANHGAVLATFQASADPDPSPNEPGPDPARSAEGAAPSPATALRGSRAPSNDLQAELALMTEAQAALRDGNAAKARRIAAQHAREFPKGQLASERAAVSILADCMSGSTSKARAEAFTRSAPASPLSERIRRACKLQ